MMFKSSKNYPSGEYVRILTQLGAKYNATTSFDRTAYYATLDKKYLKDIMELEADRMVNLTMDPKEALSERSVVIEERLMTSDNPPAARLSEMALAHYYLHHPYRLPIIGWKHDSQTHQWSSRRPAA
jgi:zinc protease